MFELSKLEANQIKPKKEQFFINELVADAALQYHVFAERKKIKINSDISASLPMIEADISLMERVIQNLLSNAIEYTPENGEIRLDVHKTDHVVEIKVLNSGEGIPEKELPHIFDRYYKVNREKSGIGGSGLGLAIVKKIIEIHHFGINVQSEKGKFTSFSVTIPIPN